MKTQNKRYMPAIISTSIDPLTTWDKTIAPKQEQVASNVTHKKGNQRYE